MASLTASKEVITFDSLGEAVCARMLEKYLPNYKIERGLTYQVDVGFNRKVDFVVPTSLRHNKETVIEYHPICLTYEFANKDSLHDFQRLKHRLRPHELDDISEMLLKEFATRYYAKRRFILDYHERYAAAELRVVWSGKSLGKAIAPYVANLDLGKFTKDFESVFAELKSGQ